VKRFLCFVFLLIGVAAAIVIAARLREGPTLLPAGGLPGEDDGEPPGEAEDLAEVRGIGPVFRARLTEAGITTFAGLAAADPEVVVAATGVPPARAADWISQAAALAAR
jgi:predicted flap endonuclease-1-like 5' DNA nuclease